MSIVGSEQWMYSAGAAGFYDFPIEQSLRFEDGDSAYLSRTPASAGTQTTYTLSMWFKYGNIKDMMLFGAGSSTSNQTYIRLWGGANQSILWETDTSATTDWYVRTNALLRDPSAWYHLTFVFDNSLSGITNKAKIYINGELASIAASSGDYPSGYVNAAVPHYIGRSASTTYTDGYMAEVNFIDGQALDPTSFGETKSGIWIPKDTAGLTFGTNGFRLAFADSGAIGDDTSGNTNDWTANNLVASDVVLDSPTNNFAVLNNLDNISTTYSEGNLKISQSSFNYNSRGSFGLTSGKYYWEVRMDSTHGEFGVCENGKMPQTDPQVAYPAYFIYNNGSTGVIYNNATSVSSSSATMTNWAAGDVAMIAYDADNGNLYHGLNGVWQNSADPAAGTGAIITGITSQFGGSLVPFFGSGTASARNWVVNFGQDSTFSNLRAAGGNADENGYGDFQYAPPSGFLSLNSANSPKGAIDTLADETPEDYFNTVLYTGNSSTNAITGVGFQPDWTWIKNRSGANSHILHDVIRGNNSLSSNLTNAEINQSAYWNGFNADGFEVTGTVGEYNASGSTYAAWNWKANGAGVSNTDGSITSTVSAAETSQGDKWFSVVKWTGNATAGATVGHGLTSQPRLIITKNMDVATDWSVLAQDANNGSGHLGYIRLNLTAAWASTSILWNNTEPTSSVFTLGSYGYVNGSGQDIIAYCFANAEGLCKVGSYVGSSFVYTGFRPAFVLIKKASGGTFASGQSDWVLYDGTRNPSNPTDLELVPNSSQVEDTYGTGGEDIDMLSNGFKILTSSSQMTGTSTYEYIYLAIAEQPFKYANAR